jgi:hypothetical protein
VTTAGELADRWPVADVTRTFDLRESEDVPVAFTIDHHEAAGHRVWIDGHGVCVIAPDGLAIHCAPPGDPHGRWRLLIGQALPIAAALRDMEVLHASAVASGGRVAAFVGATGAGKTTLALGLSLEGGAELVADDVTALAATGDDVVAHAGAPIANLTDDVVERYGTGRLGRLGTFVDESDKLHLAFAPPSGPLPIRDIYFLQRRSGVAEPTFEPIVATAGQLLAATYVSHVRTPRRLLNQLDIASRVARVARLWILSFDPAAGPTALREAVSVHLEDHAS